MPLSVVIITLNEEAHIEDCIRRVAWAGEVLVVDSGSTDLTCEKAKNLGARVLKKDWQGFGEQKHWAAGQARWDWILSLDADERLSAEAAAEIENSWSQLDPQTAYEFPRLSWHLGRWIRHGGWYPDLQRRLFNRRHSMWRRVPIHESVDSPRRKKMQGEIRHLVFRDLSHQVQTNNRYSTLQAEEHYRRSQRASGYRIFVKPWIKFLECYFVKLGFLDGLAGFVIAVGAAHSVFIRWVKVWEMERQRKSQ
ncbi:MAG: glycosyltransferase family 2 protein [Bdellovibrio sp.]